MQTVTITTATKLTATHLKKIETIVEKSMGLSKKEVRFEQVLDPSVVGGVKITAGSKEIDATVKGKLEAVKNQLLSGI